MKQLRYKTLCDVTPLGKSKVFFCALPSEFDEYFDKISNEILRAQDCSIWYLEKGAEITEELLGDLEEIPLWVFCVTPEFLLTDNDERRVLWNYAIKKHIPVLPLLQSMQVAGEFNRRCGEVQWLSMEEMKVSDGLSFRDKLKNRLYNVLIGDDESRDRIFNEFSGRIFLSYRKKDRQKAIEVMKFIHDNNKCRDIAIWYDDYLIPGEEFNQNIHKELEESDCVALVVTPGLLETPNYVMNIEYPEAVKLGKRIIPFEAVKTDEAELERCYPGIPKRIKVQKKKKSDHALDSLANEIRQKRERTPDHQYYIGLAFLYGFYMERDLKRGIKLLETAGDSGSIEACIKLQDMYSKGEFVGRDFYKAIQWLRKTIILVGDDPKLISENSHIYGNLGTYLLHIGNKEEAERAYKRGVEALTPLQGCGNGKLDFYLALNHLSYGNVFIEREDNEHAMEEAKKALEILMPLFEKNKENPVIPALIAEACMRLAEWHDVFDNFIYYYEKALSFTLPIFEKESSEYGQTLAKIYDGLAHTYQDEKMYEKAVDYYEAEMKVLDQLSAIEHRDVLGNASKVKRLSVMSHLADVLRSVGRETESVEMMEKLFREVIDEADHDQSSLTPTLIYSVNNAAGIYIETVKSMNDKSLKIDTALLINCLTRIMLAEKNSRDIKTLLNLITAGFVVIDKAFGFDPKGLERFRDRLEFFESVRGCIENINNCPDSVPGADYTNTLARWYHLKGKWICNNGGDVKEALDLLTKALELITIATERMYNPRNSLYKSNVNEMKEIFYEKDSLESFIENREAYPEGAPLLTNGKFYVVQMK